MMKVQGTIKYDADRVKGFGKDIMPVSDCEQLEGPRPVGLTRPMRVG